MLIQIILIILGTNIAIILGIFLLIGRFHKKVPQGQALVRTGFGGVKVAYDSGIFVIPALHKLESLDLSIKILEVDFTKRNSLVFKDDKTADYKALFYIKVHKVKTAIVEVAQTFACTKTYDIEILGAHFQPIFSTAIKKTAREFDVDLIEDQLDEFEERIYERIGTDLNGYILDRMLTKHLEIL